MPILVIGTEPAFDKRAREYVHFILISRGPACSAEGGDSATGASSPSLDSNAKDYDGAWLPEKQKPVEAAGTPSAATVGVATPLGPGRSGAAKSGAAPAEKRTSERAKVRFFFGSLCGLMVLLPLSVGTVTFLLFYIYRYTYIYTSIFTHMHPQIRSCACSRIYLSK